MKKDVGLCYNNELPLYIEKDNGFEAYKYTNVIPKDAPLPSRKFTNRLVLDRYEETILENKKIIDDFCAYIRYKYGDKLKIVFLFMPRFISMEIALTPHLKLWKEEIMEYLNSLDRKYSVSILDMKNEITISTNNRFYNDVNHLNYTGARAFTDVLMKKIKTL